MFLPYSDWIRLRDGDPEVAERYRNHYSARRYRDSARRRMCRVVGPGKYAIWGSPDLRSIAIFRLSKPHLNGQTGIYLAAYIRHGATRKASEELRELAQLAWAEWPCETRIFTYVNPRRVKARLPGYSFLRAGWKHTATTKNGLLVYELTKDYHDGR